MTRTWRDSVLDAVHRRANKSVDGLIKRADLKDHELDRIKRETGTVGQTPEYTLSRTLQDLRDEETIEFVGKGVYRLIQGLVDVEAVDLNEPELESLIRRKLLRLGRVETGSPVALARRRRGQTRIRAMTLQNYGDQCALCDISEASLLIASHVVPWAESEDARGDLSNVLCLCRFHDTLFELGYWSLDTHYSVVRRPTLACWPIKTLLPDNLTFRRPSAFEPDKPYLARHRQRHALDPP